MAFVMITLGGITYATSDSVFGKHDGKTFIQNAIWGLILVIGSWVILNTINPKILDFTLSLPRPPIQTDLTTVTMPNSVEGDTGATGNVLPGW